MNVLIAGFAFHLLAAAETRRLRTIAARLQPRPGPIKLGLYVPKHKWSQIPEILSEEFPDSVWRDWEPDKCPLQLSKAPLLNPDKLLELARNTDFPDMARVHRTAELLRNGARTGVEGAGRLPLGPTRNSPSLAKLPIQVQRKLKSAKRKRTVRISVTSELCQQG